MKKVPSALWYCSCWGPFNPFFPNVPFLILLKTSENLWFSDAFGRIKRENWEEKGSVKPLVPILYQLFVGVFPLCSHKVFPLCIKTFGFLMFSRGDQKETLGRKGLNKASYSHFVQPICKNIKNVLEKTCFRSIAFKKKCGRSIKNWKQLRKFNKYIRTSWYTGGSFWSWIISYSRYKNKIRTSFKSLVLKKARTLQVKRTSGNNKIF